MINQRALEKIHSYTEIGRDEGAKLLTGGEVASGNGLERGQLLPPDDLRRRRARHAHRAGGDLRADDGADPASTRFDEAIRVANGVKYGLSSSIFTRDVNKAFRAMRDLDTGITYVNAGTIGAEVHLPFGGTKDTGQRPPRGGPGRARRLHRVEVDLRRLLGQAAEGADRRRRVGACSASTGSRSRPTSSASRWPRRIRRSPVEWIDVDPADRSPVVAASGQELVPVLDHDGRIVIDSTAILHHLDELEPARELFRTPEIELFVDWFNRVWKVPPNAIEAERRAPTPDETRIAELGAELTASLDLFERLLDGRDYLFGGFSAADCAAFPFLKYALRTRAPRGPGGRSTSPLGALSRPGKGFEASVRFDPDPLNRRPRPDSVYTSRSSASPFLWSRR